MLIQKRSHQGQYTKGTNTKGSRRNGFQGNSFAFMSSRQLINCFLLTPSAEPLQAHISLIFALYYHDQTCLSYRFAAQPALSVPTWLPLVLVGTVLIWKLRASYTNVSYCLRGQGPSINDVRKIFCIFCPLPLSAFGTG